MVKTMTKLWVKSSEKVRKVLHNDERGQGMVEYGLIIALVAVVLIVAISTLSGGLDKIFTGVGNTLDSTAASVTTTT